MKVKNESEVVQSCPTLSDPMDCSLPGSSIHGIFQARVLEWVAIAFSAIAVEHGLNCSKACGVFLDQGSNLYLLRWQADSLALNHQGSLPIFFNTFFNDVFKCCVLSPISLMSSVGFITLFYLVQ